MVVILAGGEGVRLGGAKPLRMLAGRTLIDRALRRASSWSDDVSIALRSDDQVPDLGAPVLLDAADVPGPLAGVLSALRAAAAADRSHVLTIPCDMPFLPDDVPARLEAALGRCGVAMAESDGDLYPVVALWSVGALEAIEPYVSAGRGSLKGLAETVGLSTVVWPAEAFANVNTPEELARAEQRLVSEIENAEGSSGRNRR